MKLIIRVPGQPESQAELRAGANILGRSMGNDISISHPSISSRHCEILLDAESLTVRDFHSTNGTFINGERVEQSALEAGQTLRLGEVELFVTSGPDKGENKHEGQDAREMEPTGATGRVRLRIAHDQPPEESATATVADRIEPEPLIPQPPKIIPIARNPKLPSFFQTVPGAFAYPFKENGLYLLIGGTVFFAGLDLFSSFAFGGVFALIGVGLTGYIFLFMQSIITTSATGEDAVPSWPDWDDWWGTGLEPYLIMLGLFLCCLGPGYLCLKFASPEPTFFTVASVRFGGLQALGIPLLMGGLLYLPMALLAVSMYDSLAAINPMLVLPSIFRILGQYTLACLVLAILAAADFALAATVKSLFAEAIASNVIARFLSLYSFITAMRLLGLLYFTQSKRLSWTF